MTYRRERVLGAIVFGQFVLTLVPLLLLGGGLVVFGAGYWWVLRGDSGTFSHLSLISLLVMAPAMPLGLLAKRLDPAADRAIRELEEIDYQYRKNFRTGKVSCPPPPWWHEED